MDQPRLRQIGKPTKSTKAVIFIHGGWCQNWGDKNEDELKLITPLKRAGWEEAVYHLWWDSSENSWLNFSKIESIRGRAKRVGSKYVSNLVSSRISEKEVSILAYSFGARVAYYALDAWSQHNLRDVILLGGAIKRDSSKNWGHIASKLNGRLFNIYNKHDPILDRFQHYQGGTSPCGLKPIKEQHPKIVNINATYLVGKDHSLRKYLEHLPSFINWN